MPLLRVRSATGTALLVTSALVLLLWPSHAYAWGPLAHLSFSSGALSDLSQLGFTLRQLLARFSGEFLYGSLAADIVVGKNLSAYAKHCHNWRVGFSVLDRARTDAQRAFSFGFLAHLAVDTVAHNYYVPYKTVQSFGRRGCGHAYWELRYDQRLPTDLWRVARQVTEPSFREHDEHLQQCLHESHVLPFFVSKTLFGSLLLAARLRKWQRLSELIASEREQPLHEEEIRECRRLAVGQIVGMLKDGPEAVCVRADPTGSRNLYLADTFRISLKRRADLPVPVAQELARRARPAFRRGILGPVALPELPDGVRVG